MRISLTRLQRPRCTTKLFAANTATSPFQIRPTCTYWVATGDQSLRGKRWIYMFVWKVDWGLRFCLNPVTDSFLTGFTFFFLFFPASFCIKQGFLSSSRSQPQRVFWPIFEGGGGWGLWSKLSPAAKCSILNWYKSISRCQGAAVPAGPNHDWWGTGAYELRIYSQCDANPKLKQYCKK